MEILYTLRTDSPAGHRGQFRIDLDQVNAPTVDLVLPSWVPGSYIITNFSRGFRDVKAAREPDGSALRVERVDKARWRVHTEGATRLRVEYTVYGHQLVTEAFDVTPEHLFVNAGLCLPYVDGHLDEPAVVALEVPPDWTVVTELEELDRHPPRYRSRNYDELVDSPIDAGRPLVITIRPAGIPHRIVLCGEGGNYEVSQVEQDVGKVVEASIRLVGDSPLRHYTFFYHLADVSDGGLEHATSCSCVIPRAIFRPADAYRWFLSLTAHEYLHLYNVKRIRPKVLGPFDYTRENYTRLLWWMEGTTDYFAELVLRRSGLVAPEKFLERRAELIRKYLDTPGRNRLSLEELSLISWVDRYHPFEETPNQSVSYYPKGDLVSMVLDLELRERTENRASLESVLRLLWKEYGKVGKGLEENELPAVIERATGCDVEPFFERYIRGTAEVDFPGAARRAGLEFAPKSKRPEDDDPEPGDLGVDLEDSGGLARVTHSYQGRPAHTAGLTPGDEIVAINGERTRFSNFEKTMLKFPSGSPMEITVFRRGFLHQVALTTGTPPPKKYSFSPSESPSELARKVYESWVGVAWAPKKPPS